MSVEAAREIVDRTPVRLRSEYSKYTQNPFYGTDLDLETTMVPAWMYYATKQERDVAARMYEGRGKQVVLGHSMFGFKEGGGKKWRLRGVDHRGNPKQKWLLPFKRGKKNYEDVGYLPYVLGHDIGFSGNKMYRPVKYENGAITVMSNDLAREQYDTYSRKSVMDAIKRLAGGKSNSKRNPQLAADDMYASFHGEPTDETIEFQNEEHYHSHLTALGELIEPRK
jgi:hypothetical protein